MKRQMLVLAILGLSALVLLAAPATMSAAGCIVFPSSGPVGTDFAISCPGFTPGIITNIYAVEPDGRASGLNIYGFFPNSVKADEDGNASFYFITEFPGAYSIPPGHYIFVVQELGLGNTIKYKQEIGIDVSPADHPLSGAALTVTLDGRAAYVTGSGYEPFEAVNIWITQPPGAQCSGLGIDQLTLAALAGNGSSLWSAPGTVKADADGNIAFTITFNASACIGEHFVSARALGSGRGAQAAILLNGNAVTTSGNISVWVDPPSVPAFGSLLAVYASGFPANAGVNCWFTRPDGRVLSFINATGKTDAGGNLAVLAALDDFPPYTSTDPGLWYVTCATPDQSYLGIATFNVFALLDP